MCSSFLNLAVKTALKSVNIWRSYLENLSTRLRWRSRSAKMLMRRPTSTLCMASCWSYSIHFIQSTRSPWWHHLTRRMSRRPWKRCCGLMRVGRTDEAGAIAARIRTIITRSSTRWLRTVDTRKSAKNAWAKVREVIKLSLIHIWRCRRSYACRSRWSPYH